jgi:hypothetical protein
MLMKFPLLTLRTTPPPKIFLRLLKTVLCELKSGHKGQTYNKSVL